MTKEEECVLLISDTHVGKVTKTYNVSLFRSRLDSLRQNLIKVKEIINRSYKLPVLNIFMLGDVIDGEEIYPTQAWKQEVDVDTQIDIAVNEFSNFITSLLGKRRGRFKKIKIFCVQGNHGRSGRRKSEKTNFDRIFDKRLSDRLEFNEKISLDLSDEWYMVVDVMGHGYLLFHGDNIYSYMNIPMYGIIQRSMRLKVGGISRDFEAVCMGHFHNIGLLYWNDLRIFMNGTFVTDDDFAQKRLGLKTATKFWFFGVNTERAMTWSYLLDCTQVG